MRTKLLFFAALFITVMSYGQECLGVSFNPPATPSSFTFNYKTVSGITGWYDASDVLTTPPSNSGNIDGSVGVFEDLTYFFGNFNSYSLYVAPGVTFTGDAVSLKDSNFIFEGKADFDSTPGTGGTKIYIYPDGELTFPENFSVSSNEFVHNAGIFNIGIPGSFVADLSVTSNFYSYPESATIVNGDIHFPGRYYNCGSLEAYGDIHTGGGSDFENNCSTYIHGDFHLNGDYTNDGIMFFKGNVNFIASAIFYNTGVLVFDDLNLANDQIVGQITQNYKPTLIIRNTANLTGGAAVIDHYFYNSSATPPPGGGFNSVCGTCTADIYIATQATVPTTPKDILKDCGIDVRVGPPSIRATLDFDGVDDYVSTPNFIDGTGEVTLMAWMKYDAGASGDMIIAGEGNGIKLWIKGGNKPYFSVTVAGYPIRNVAFGTLPSDEWHHMVGTYSATTGLMKIYIDGKLKSTSDFGVTGLMIQTAPAHNGNFEIGRSSRNQVDREYFKGAIDEVRVFDEVLTSDQISKIIYQEIEESSGYVHGSVVSKEIRDVASNNLITWSSLLAYYPMTDIVSYERTIDYSSNNRYTTLHNITTLQDQTAPLPYETVSDGDWSTESVWKHGDVWDIETIPNNNGSIVNIKNKVTTSDSHSHLALIIDDSKTLTVNGDNEINNSWYLELNGTLDLSDDSQLVQGNKSDLVTSANGKVLRRQSGASNVFWYTYMSSPVGATAATTLSDNNTAANNANNTAFTFNTLKEGNGSLVQFTNAHNEVGKISTRWMYTFQNGITYFDWAYLYPTTALNPGVGYIHKGTGNAGLEQQYLFEGKPNNGTVLIAADDVDGDAGNESQPDVTQTTTLIGNPYPSAIDAHKFIDDNISVIDGTIYLWQQWAGSNHILFEYEGGYAVLNKMAKIRAYQFVGYSGADNGSQDGTLTPTQYIAPGQSFMTEVVADGNIEFNNAQRIFKKESNGETEFFRNTASTKGEEEKEEMTKIILNFVTSDNRSRELVIGFGDQTTEGYDRGYDAKMFDLKSDDIYMKLNSDKLIANAQPTLNANMEIPIGLKATGSYKYKIKATKLINFPSTMDIYLRDNQEKIYHDLRDGAYTFKSKSGEFNNRFDIVFAAKGNTKETQQEALNDVQIYFNTNSDRLFVKGLNNTAKELTIINMAGQQLIRLNNISTQRMTAGVALSNLSNGVYIVSILTDTNQSIDKKIIID